MHLAQEMQVSDHPEAVPSARKFAAQSLEGAPADLVADAQIVVSELVTNAILHGSPPVVVRVTRRDHGARIEVGDGSRAVPLRARPDEGAMTGRGLALVESIAESWGVEALPDGKIVWCELVLRGEIPQPADPRMEPAQVERLLAGWDEPDAASVEESFTVTLGDVPTDLLLAAKAHVDNLVREFTLAAEGARSGSTAAVPPHLALLIETVVHGFAQARNAIKRQAVAAAQAGQPRTRLTLTLPPSAASAGDAYLAALDEADDYAHAARLLTLASPPQHRVFRHWYVESLVAQLRARAAGLPPPPVQTFEDRLLAELETVSVARQLADRSARLQQVTSALSGATTTDEVTSVVVHQGLDALGATSGSVMLPSENDTIHVSSAIGYAEQVVRALSSEPADARLPGATVLRTGEPVWLESRRDIEQQFPELSALEPDTQSLCAVPATLAGRVLAALRFSFQRQRLFDADERRFVMALAAQTAQALDRAAAYSAEQQARAAAESLAVRLSRLQQITTELATASDETEIAATVLAHVQSALAAVGAAIYLLSDEGVLHLVDTRGDESGVGQARPELGIEETHPVSEAVRTNAPVVVAAPGVPQHHPELAPDRDRGPGAHLVCVPLHTGDKRLGAVALSFPAAHDVSDAGELAFLASVADAAAQAIDRTRALHDAAEAADRLAFLADASAELSASLDLQATLATLSRLIVPRLADWCSISLLEGGGLQTALVAHADPAKVALAERLQRRFPADPDAPHGVPQVIRTGQPELYAHITDDVLVTTAVNEEHLALRRELGLRSALLLPLRGSRGVFGALTLVYGESRRHYSPADLTFAQEVARRAAVAVENARRFHQQTGRLAAIERVAEAAQQAILAPVPATVGPVRLAADYVSAAREALVGGDLYEVVGLAGSTRLLVGDVRGKGLDAVRLATVVLGYFRASAGDCPSLVEVARQVDARVAPHLGDEDFVTALLVDIHDDGRAEVVTCGHPPPILADRAVVRELECSPSLPLGLGSAPEVLEVQLEAGDRLLLYTDGLIEARDSSGAFADVRRIVEPLATGELSSVPRRILEELRQTVGHELDDDLALLVAEYRP